MDIRVNEGSGQAALCSRCGVPCRVAQARNEDARLLMNAPDARSGWCGDCAATDFLKSTEPCGMLLERSGPEILRTEHIQDQFARIMVAGEADVSPPEINWDRVIANWHLPFTKRGGKARGGRRRPGEGEGSLFD
jgi:hypothetical protein